MTTSISDKMVIKRNGRVVEWDSFRIQNAVFRAAVLGKYKNNPLRANTIANNVTKMVEHAIATSEFDKIEIDTIQNNVVKQLGDFDKDVAHDFLAYKIQQDIERGGMVKKYSDTLDIEDANG